MKSAPRSVRLLVVDDEPNLLYSLKKGLESPDVEVLTAQTGCDGIAAVESHRPDAVVLDVRLPDMSGLDAFTEIRAIDSRIPVILVTAYSMTETAIEAMKRGAFDYLLKPVEFDRLQDVVTQALQVGRMSRVPAMFEMEDEGIHTNVDQIIGNSPQMQEVYKAIGRVASQNVNVLILGESGTGKEMVARAIYQHSRRAQEPFLAINCAALPDNLLESELFGHERGAFTGADRRRIGKFEQVHGGTIFLDEVGDMTAATQAKVLRLLQDGTFERVGSNDTLRADVRIIAATNRHIEQMVEAGKFRHDLMYRLKVFTIELPPLRERSGDLVSLVEHFVRIYSREFGKTIRSIDEKALDLLQHYEWPGNIRELQGVIKFALLRCPGDVLTGECFPLGPEAHKAALTRLNERAPAHEESIRAYLRALLESGELDLYRRIHADIDRIILPEILSAVGGNQSQASELLGISRGTLRIRLADLKLTLPDRRFIGGSDPDEAP